MLGLPRKTVTFGQPYRHPIAALTQSVRVRFALQASSFSASARARMMLGDVSFENPGQFRDDAQRKAAQMVAKNYEPLGAPTKPLTAVIIKYEKTPNPKGKEEKELLVRYTGRSNAGTRWNIDNHIQCKI
ncbi:MAG: hypothetical protein ASARMPRED_000697 [Alectoria sarmentosa]|nr:MAG: hypothetical protein ASARMPRED_000697 [Alectoria sarmentosa]